MHVEHDVDVRFPVGPSQGHPQRARLRIGPTRGIQFATMPGHVGKSSFIRAAIKAMTAPKQRMILSEFDHSPPESVYVLVLSHKIPIKPTDLVVLTVGVVVSLLTAPDFISGKDHRYASREHENGSEIFDLTLTQRFDRRLGCVALDSVVPAEVVIDAVAIVFPVFLIMFCVVG